MFRVETQHAASLQIIVKRVPPEQNRIIKHAVSVQKIIMRALNAANSFHIFTTFEIRFISSKRKQMKFSDVLGQKEIKQRLIRTVKEERISHAQLFFGPSGVGKLPLAIAYAQYISCENRGDDDSCGVCPSCLKISKLVHPDLHFVFPVVNSKEIKQAVSDNYIEQLRKTIPENPYISENQWYETIGAENKQGLINKAEGAAILRKLSLKSYEGEFKIMIIWLA